MNDKISHEEFVTRAIETLREPRHKGIHSVYSGFNEAFRAYFDEDPIEATKRLAAKGVIQTRPARGGVILYLPGQAPQSSGRGALEKILGEVSSGRTVGGENKASLIALRIIDVLVVSQSGVDQDIRVAFEKMFTTCLHEKTESMGDPAKAAIS